MCMAKRLFFIALAAVICSVNAVAQKTISGKIVTEDKQPLIGATIRVVGSNIAAVSNIDGEFKIEVPKKKDKLRVSYVGFEEPTVPAKQGMVVVMKEPNYQPTRKERRYIKLSNSDKKIIGDVNDFTFRMMREVYNNKSCVASPLIVACLLAMTSNGAAGKTLSEMQTLLGSSPAELNSFYKRIIPYLTDSQWGSSFSMANALFTNKSFPMSNQFVAEASDSYQAMARSMNFGSSSPLKAINDWCKEKTGGMIPKIIDKTSPSALMYALNAVYFDGKWKHEFDPSKTKDGKFTLPGGKEETVPMMRQQRILRYAKAKNCAMLMLPYQGETSFEMIVLLPDKGYSVEKLLEDYGYASWKEAWSTRTLCDVNVKLPRFEIDTDQPLNALMSRMGIPSAFDEQRADFSRMVDMKKMAPDSRLHISNMKQKARIEVEETGTKAAAATLEEIVVTGAAHPVVPRFKKVDFHATRPFAYMITEHATGMILFMGVYNGE